MGVDYSGAGSPEVPQSGLQVARASVGEAAELVQPEARRRWSRGTCFEWISDTLDAGRPTLVAIDHAFSFPDTHFRRRRLRTWDAFLVDFARRWPLDQPGVRVDDLRAHQAVDGSSDALRLTDRWTPGARSVFHFDAQGQVAKSTHAGLPWIRRLRRAHPDVHFWPFDGFLVARGRSVVVEGFPSLVRRRYPRPARRSVDAHDAWCLATWMAERQHVGLLARYFRPPLTAEEEKVARREGWIFGMM